MGARNAINLRGSDIEVGRWDVYDVQVSTNDTITLAEYDTGSSLSQVLLFKKSDRSTVTQTSALNVITVTQAGLTNIDCLLFVAGVSAD